MPLTSDQDRSEEMAHKNRFLSLRCQIILWVAAIIAIILSCVLLYSYFGIKL